MLFAVSYVVFFFLIRYFFTSDIVFYLDIFYLWVSLMLLLISRVIKDRFQLHWLK